MVRKTRETNVEIELDLDGSGQYSIQTGLPFLDHMLAQVAAHGLFDLEIKAEGDLQIDPHHTVEDVALAWAMPLHKALGERHGIVRMASAACPMDETLAWTVIDFSGRPYAVIQANWTSPEAGGIATTLFTHFLESFATQARCNLHAQVMYGRDDHHKAEAFFKSLGRALDAATQIDERRGGDPVHKRSAFLMRDKPFWWTPVPAICIRCTMPCRRPDIPSESHRILPIWPEQVG